MTSSTAVTVDKHGWYMRLAGRAFAVVGALLGFVGGLIPLLSERVASGDAPAWAQPEQYFGAPSSWSAHPLVALAGGLLWAALLLLGALVRLPRVVRLTVLLVALALTGVINVVLPLSRFPGSWSVLGVCAAVATAVAVVLLVVTDRIAQAYWP